jgi:hypothetical protein
VTLNSEESRYIFLAALKVQELISIEDRTILKFLVAHPYPKDHITCYTVMKIHQTTGKYQILVCTSRKGGFLAMLEAAIEVLINCMW